MNEMNVFDVTVIGGGPAGLFSAFYSGLRKMKTKVIEYHPYLGGKVRLYPEKTIWDVGGLPPVTGADLIDNLVAQGLTFQPEVVLNEKIVAIQKQDGLFVLEAASGRKHYSKTVIVAVGSGILKHTKLDVAGAERFEHSNLHYTVTSLEDFRDQTVLISGGGNSAIDWAVELEPYAKKVYIVCRGEELCGHEAQITHIMNSSVECLPQTTITNLIPAVNEDRIQQVELTRNGSDVFRVDVDAVIVNHGFDMDTELLKNAELGLELVDDYFIKGTAKCESTVPGLFAAGDILHYDGKLNLLAGCFQDAANAVNQAKKYIEPDAEAFAMVSSHNDVFNELNKKWRQSACEPQGQAVERV